MEELQADLKACKEKWGKEIELSKAEKGAPGYPFPVCCTRYIAQPEHAAAWDCEELPIRLVVKSADVAEKPVSVEVPPIFPGELSQEIEKAVEAEWKKQLGKKRSKADTWAVGKTLDWVESKYVDLLSLVRAYVDTYVGCDAMGASMRRYTLVGPAAEEDEEEDEDVVDEEEQQRRIEEYMKQEEARIEAEIEENIRSGETKRQQAEQGIYEDGPKARQLSKKEQAELNKTRKERSGQRWRKTASKTHKPVREDGDKSLIGLPGQPKKAK